MDRIKHSMNCRWFLTAMSVLIVAVAGQMTGGCHEDSCVAQGTLIRTPRGEVPVEELRVGDPVYSYDLVLGEIVPARIVRIRTAYETCVEFRNGSDVYLTTTMSHRIYSPQTGQYEQASKWSSGQLQELGLVVTNNSFTTRNSFEVVPVGRRQVFDITVSSSMANFVANGVLVHNKTPDLRATDPIRDLESIQETDSSISLSWTVPGDDHLFTENYDLRYSDSEFVLNNFWRYDTIHFPGPAAPAGEKDTIEVTGLSAGSPYWFNVRTYSNEGGPSDNSNVVVDTTLP